MDIVRSHSLPCISSKEELLKVPPTNRENSKPQLSTIMFVTPEKLKRKIRKRILSYRLNNEKINNENLRRYEKYNEVKAFKASIVVQDEEIGKIFLVDRKVAQAPPTPIIEESTEQTDMFTNESRKPLVRPLLLPPPQLPPIYKTKLFPIVPRDLDIKTDIFTPRPSIEAIWRELEDCRYLRKPTE